MEERRKLLADDPEPLVLDSNARKHRGGPSIGSSAQRHQIAFVPRKENKAFNNGRGRSFEYHYLSHIDFELDYSELVLAFPACLVILEGPDLRALYHRIRDHAEDTVIESDPLLALHDPLSHPVTGLRMEVPKG